MPNVFSGGQKPVAEHADLSQRGLEVMRGHKGKEVQVLIGGFQPVDIFQQLPVQLRDFFLRSLPFADLQFQVPVDGYQLLFLRQQPLVLPVEIHEDAYFRPQQLGIHGFVNIIHGARAVSFKEILLPIIIGGDKDDGDMPQPLPFIDQRGGFETIQIRHLHIHQDQREIKSVNRSFRTCRPMWL